MTTYEHWSDDPEEVAEYERDCEEMNCFVLEHRYTITRKLRRIDRLRVQLIEAQNDLGTLLVTAGNYTREMFTDFYQRGGVTAADWEAYYPSSYPEKFPQPPRVHGHGQLRLVPPPPGPHLVYQQKPPSGPQAA